MKFKFIYDFKAGDYADLCNTRVEYQTDAVDLEQVFSEFKRFLMAAGMPISQNDEIVLEREDE